MKENILGLHHITAIAGNPQKNYDFYTKVLGLRMVKKTVNFDAPDTYHFYYGNEQGTPGTILTFFSWEQIGQGFTGTGMAKEIGYSVPDGSLDFWKERFKQFNISFVEKAERFGEEFLSFIDKDGLNFSLIVSKIADERKAWETKEIGKESAIKGFQGITLSLKKIDKTAKVLTDILGYRLLSQEGNRFRFITDAVPNASIVDLLENPDSTPGRNAIGTIHHLAFRVANENIQMEYREKILSNGLQITPKIDRNYFYSVYFHEPGGILFEIATDNPGFAVDEPLSELGTHLKLPKQFEHARVEIEKVLTPLKVIE